METALPTADIQFLFWDAKDIKVCGKVSTCIFISSGFGFNLAPRKLPKFNRVNDKVFCAFATVCLF